MPDDIRIPTLKDSLGARAPVSSSYRARRAGPSMGVFPMRLAAAGLGGLLLLGLGGWAVMGRRPAVVPVIEADSSPIRVKPENPGGMQVAGAEELGDTGGDKMAPAAEAPAPQALRAQVQQTGPAPDAPAPVAAEPVPAAPTAAVPPPRRGAVAGSPPPGVVQPVPPGVSPLPDTPPRVVAGKPAAPAVAAVKPAGGATMVQLGALGSEAAARAEWDKLARSAPEALSGHQPVVEKTEHDGRTLWRLRTGGFADVADATGFCAKLRAKGGACTIASF